MAASEVDVAARLIERLLVDPTFRARFRRDPAGACREAGLEGLAQEMSVGGGKAMYTLDMRESKSSLAGVMMAAAMEGVGIYQFTENVLPHLEELPHQVGQVISRVHLPAIKGALHGGGGGGAVSEPAVPAPNGDGVPGAANGAGALPDAAPPAAGQPLPEAAPPAAAQPLHADLHALGRGRRYRHGHHPRHPRRRSPDQRLPPDANSIRALGASRRVFAHIPLIHGPDGAKLSKRHGALSVIEYREMGMLPEAMRNYLLRLGWAHGDDEIISTEQAIAVVRSRRRRPLAGPLRFRQASLGQCPLAHGTRRDADLADAASRRSLERSWAIGSASRAPAPGSRRWRG